MLTWITTDIHKMPTETHAVKQARKDHAKEEEKDLQALGGELALRKYNLLMCKAAAAR